MENTPVIGEIYMMNFDGDGHIQSGRRPGIIFQNNVGNANSPNVIAIPLTTCLKKQNMPSHVVIHAAQNGLRKDSMALCENPVSISKGNIEFYISKLQDSDMKRVARASVVATSAVSFLSQEELLDAWRLSKRLNKG